MTWSNLLFPLKVIVSYIYAIRIIRKFKPHVVVGTGGYASGPMMMAATRAGIPTVIQEQNSFAGLVNRQVAARANKICVAYEGMEKYFPAKKIVLTGNPVRKDILTADTKRDKALDHFGFDGKTKTLLVVGGSLGARTINESIINNIEKLVDARVQMIWQTGKGYYDQYQSRLAQVDKRLIRVRDFVREMDLAYAVADVVISRSGALAVSEISIAKKPVILVPSPNVAEDHQTKNAKALSEQHAAILIVDRDANEKLVDEALKLLFDEQRAGKMTDNISRLARPDATVAIVDEIEKLLVEKSVHPDYPAREKDVYVLDRNKSNQKMDVSSLQPVLVKK
jgi:UDP-N-acetylglucosamine--N-acetylmuramyl-(pentapeptide) pyrophosphoryl-undecaprenol N-acetylglucosamine transferase